MSWAFENLFKPVHERRLQRHGISAVADSVESFVALVGIDVAVGDINPNALKAYELFTRSQGYSWHVARMRRERIEAIRDFVLPRSNDAAERTPTAGTLRFYVEGSFKQLAPASVASSAKRAVDKLCEWLETDVLVAEVTPELIVEFESSLSADMAEKHGSMIRRIMRTTDPVRFRIRRNRPICPGPLNPSPWLLANIFETQYEPTRLRPKSVNMKRLYRCTLRTLDRYLGRFATLDDLSDETINGFAQWRLQQNKSKNTVNRDLWNLLAFWRWCHDKGLVERRPDVPIEAAPKRVPVAWTTHDLRKLMRTIRSLNGSVDRIPASDWWQALLLVLWDTGERIGAVIDLQWPNIDLRHRWVTFPAETRKGGQDDNAVRLSSQTIAALRRIKRIDGPVFPWPYCRTYLWKKYGGILERAGLPSDRMSKFHRVRKSVASYVEAAGGNATIMLRHSDRRVTEKYIDPRIAKRQQPVDVLFRLED